MVTRRATKATRVQPQSTLQCFARVTKSTTNRSATSKKDDAFVTESIPSEIIPPQTSVSPLKRKRNLLDAGHEKLGPAAKAPRTVKAASTKTTADTLHTPKKQSRVVNSLLTPESTPTSSKKAASRLASAKSSTLEQPPYFTPPQTPQTPARHISPDCSTPELPVEVQSLIQLHACTAKALSLHFAHNGFGAPIDVRMITPSISKIWGVRRTTLEDLRRSLGLLKTADEDAGKKGLPIALNIHLSHYGSGKICLERDNHETAAVDERVWNDTFYRELDRRWQSWTSSGNDSKKMPTSMDDFIASLPLAAMTDCSALSKMRPTQLKGQQRLEDLKVGAIRAQTKAQTQPVSIDATAKTAIKNRSQALLERLLAKKREASDTATGGSETAEQLLRRTALDRMDEVATVLSLAKGIGEAAGNRQHTHSMNVLLDNIQRSTRNAISKAEAEETIRVIAEKAPAFVSLVAVGRVTCVVINASMRPQNLKAMT